MEEKPFLSLWAPRKQRNDGPYAITMRINPATPTSFLFFYGLRSMSRNYRNSVYEKSLISDGALTATLSLQEYAQFFLGFHSSSSVSAFLKKLVEPDDEISQQLLQTVFSSLDERVHYAYYEYGRAQRPRRHTGRLLLRHEDIPIFEKRIPKGCLNSREPKDYQWSWERWTKDMGDPTDYEPSPPLIVYRPRLHRLLWGQEQDDIHLIVSFANTFLCGGVVQHFLPDDIDNFLEPNFLEYAEEVVQINPSILLNLFEKDRQIREQLDESVAIN